MSEFAFLTASQSLFQELLNLDDELNAILSQMDKSADEIRQMFLDRISVYERSSVLPLNEKDKLLLQNR